MMSHDIWMTFKEHKAFVIIALVVFTVAIAGIPLWYYVIQPKLEMPSSDVRYSITRVEHSWKKVSVSKRLSKYDINPKQYVMVDGDGRALNCMSFTGDGASPRHTVKIVSAFGDTKSRNLLLQQYPDLRMGLKSGYINVDFCFLQTTNEYSVLAVEALAESDYNNPRKTWDVIYDLMMTDTSDMTTTSQRISAILTVLRKHGTSEVTGKPEISTASIHNGTFYQWGYTMSNKQDADYVPAVFWDGTAINNKVSIYDPDAVWKYIKANAK